MFQPLLKLPLSAKCGALAALICAAAGLTLLVSSMTASKQILLETTRMIGQQWTNQLASQSQQALLRNDRVSLQAILQDYTNSPLIVYGSIRNGRQEMVAEAGHWREENLNYNTKVAGDERLGTVKLSLSVALISNEIRDLGKTLLLLTILLCCFSYAVVAVPTRRIERYLELALNNLAQPLNNSKTPYQGQDKLGLLLQEVHDPQIRLSKLGKERYRDYFLLHCQWQGYEKLQTQMDPESFKQLLRTTHSRADAIARLYHANIVCHRHDGVSLRFFDVPDTDEMLFRALCCAELFQSLDRALKCRPGVASIQGHGTERECAAMECEAVANLCTATSGGTGIWIDQGCQANPRLEIWAERRGHRIGALKPPYDELLARQQAQLKNLDLAGLS